MVASSVKSHSLSRFLPEIFIFVLAFVLRAWGIHFGLPDLFHADEPIIVNHALAYGTGDLNPHFFNIPPLVSYLLFGLYGIFFVIGKGFGFFSSAADFAAAFFRDPTLFYLIGRLCLGVIPGVISIFGLMRLCANLGMQNFDRLFAGLLFAVCFIHVSDSHYIYADIPLVLIGVFFFVFLTQLDLEKWSSHVFLGTLIGVASACKYNGVFLAAPYLWFVLGLRRSAAKSLSFLSSAGICAGIVFFLFNPYSLIDFHFFISELQEQSTANSGVDVWHHLRYSLFEGISLPICILSLWGCTGAFRRKDIKSQSLVFFCVVYYLLLWRKGQPYARYVLPMVPFLIILAIQAFADLRKQLPRFSVLWFLLIFLSFG